MSHIHVRCDDDAKEDYVRIAANMGYPNLSSFIKALLDSMRDRYLDPDWTSHLLHVSDSGQILAIDPASSPGPVRMGTAAFPVVGPEHFWRHVREIIETSSSEKVESP